MPECREAQAAWESERELVQLGRVHALVERELQLRPSVQQPAERGVADVRFRDRCGRWAWDRGARRKSGEVFDEDVAAVVERELRHCLEGQDDRVALLDSRAIEGAADRGQRNCVRGAQLFGIDSPFTVNLILPNAYAVGLLALTWKSASCRLAGLFQTPARWLIPAESKYQYVITNRGV